MLNRNLLGFQEEPFVFLDFSRKRSASEFSMLCPFSSSPSDQTRFLTTGQIWSPHACDRLRLIRETLQFALLSLLADEVSDHHPSASRRKTSARGNSRSRSSQHNWFSDSKTSLGSTSGLLCKVVHKENTGCTRRSTEMSVVQGI